MSGPAMNVYQTTVDKRRRATSEPARPVEKQAEPKGKGKGKAKTDESE